MTLPALVLVEWVDAAHTNDGWVDPNNLDEFGVSRCTCVGFVLRDTDEELLLAQSIDSRHGQVDAVMAIPKVAVVRRTKLA